MEVRAHEKEGAHANVELWQEMSREVAIGDTFEIMAGCNKLFATCKSKFANGVNFRGFPHIPGNDFVTTYPVRGEPNNDGGSRSL
jgi:uncharacterized phage protein (TIGR02218 family)